MAAQGRALGLFDAVDCLRNAFVGHRHRVPVGVDQALAVDGERDMALPEQQIAALKFALHHRTRRFLQVGITGQSDAAGVVDDLGKARAIQTCA